ncbi:MAG TPA: hypothetical protein VEC12_13630 [Bacteroidia bacterium]|nr:hypothetical protein [Bacteroidia bacterium]
MAVLRTGVLILLFFSLTQVSASLQVGDFLIYNDDTVEIFTQPLEVLYDTNTRPDSIFFHNPRCYSTNCWRGYVALWLLKDSQLYLVEVIDCCGMNYSASGYPAGNTKFDLEQIVDRKYFKNGRVEAGWVSFCLYNPIGSPVYIRNQGYYAFYMEERLFCFENGKLVNIEYYDNPKTKHNTIYTVNDDSLANFVYKHVNWDSISNSQVVVDVIVFSTEDGKAWVGKNKSSNESSEFRQISTAIAQLPKWDSYYRLGEHQEKLFWFRKIVFNEELRKKYHRAK